MEILFDPNVAYLLLVAGTFFILIAILTPGTGIAEIIALFCIVLSGYAVYHLSFNWWALLLLIVSLVPFLFSIRTPGRGIWLALAILGLVVGSVFFFPAEHGLVSVNPVLAILTSALYAASIWIVARKVLQAAQVRPVHDVSALIGQRGEAKTSIKEEGSVQVSGELWSARSPKSIPAGSVIRVVGREGFTLLVEKDKDS